MKRSSFKQITYNEKLEKAKNANLRRQKSISTKVSSKGTKTSQKNKSGKRMIYGIKVWSLKVADTYFSNWLRKKISKCELCGAIDGLTVSHYIGRKEKATRFLIDNCDVFCWSCHAKWEDRKQYEYRDWKINKIGAERHDKLKKLQRSSLGEKDAIYNCMKLLGKI